MRHPNITSKRVLFFLISFISFIPFLHSEDFFFDSAGIKIHYVIEGKGEPVLLIHGFGQNTQRMTRIIEALSDEFRVIAMDVRGHGQSDKPHDPGSYGMSIVEDSLRVVGRFGYGLTPELSGPSTGFRTCCGDMPDCNQSNSGPLQ